MPVHPKKHGDRDRGRAGALGFFLFLAAFAARGSMSGHAFRIEAAPGTLELRGPRAEHGLVVTAVGLDGRRFDITAQCGYASDKPGAVNVSTNGQIRALADGEAVVTVRYFDQVATIRVKASGSASSAPPSFREEIIPLLTREGCNAGSCHGKLAGQNNFRLSLRGYAPEWDHAWLTREFNGRRVNFAFPEESLIVLKPLARVPHEGRQRFAEGSRAHRLLVDWIAARAPGPIASESDAARLEVLPGDRSFEVGESQQLLVRAFYPDGAERDITWLAQFFSNDDSVVKVTPDGLATILRPGETSVRVHYQDLVEIVTFTTPFDNKVSPGQYSRRKNFIDDQVFPKLAKLRIPPSPECDDRAFVRRAFLDTIGTLPTPEEVRQFEGDTRPDKRAGLADALLARPEFVDYWTLQMDDLFQNRKERDHDVRGAKGVRALHNWLREQLAANRPWDQMARDILTAAGDSTRAPQVGYYVVAVGEKRAEESEIMDSVAQALLGSRVGCARCHNHPLERYTQDDYYHFAAFFARVSLKRESPDKSPTTLEIASHREEELARERRDLDKQLGEAESGKSKLAGADLDKAEEKVKDLKRRMAENNKALDEARAKPPKATQPRTREELAPQTLDRSPLKIDPGEDPRAALANWIVSPTNETFSGAMVNRLWKHFFEIGLVEPVDDIRASNPPGNAPLYHALAREFTEHGYDLKHVIRVILNSETYQLSSATLPGNEGDRRFYSHYYARRLGSEALADAICQATGAPDNFPGYPVGVRAITVPDPGVNSYFLSLFGRSERVTACACERKGDVTLPQLLHLQNGEEIAQKIRSGDGRLALLLKEQDNAKIADELFCLALGRPASAKEREAVEKSLKSGPRDEVFQDLFWALLNTKEFAFNH
jgi:hypothetical protein